MKEEVPPQEFVTYCETESCKANQGDDEGHSHRQRQPKAKMEELSNNRARILAASLTDDERAIFEIPIEAWRTTDRRKLPGWRCALPNAVSFNDLKPVNASDSILRRIALYRGPVTNLELEAIVNAANTQCLGGGGVDGAIHAAAGPLLLRECATFNGCATGACRVTKGYRLPAYYVIHTVGPVGEKPEFLRRCYRSIFSVAQRNRLRSLGFCSVSTGVYGYPLIPATRIALMETKRFLEEHTDVLDLCCFACFRHEEYAAYTNCLLEIFGTKPCNDVDVKHKMDEGGE